MSIEFCTECQQRWDSDTTDYCPRCYAEDETPCEACHEAEAVANVEVFEVSGMVMCEDCGDQCLQDVGRFA